MKRTHHTDIPAFLAALTQLYAAVGPDGIKGARINSNSLFHTDTDEISVSMVTIRAYYRPSTGIEPYSDAMVAYERALRMAQDAGIAQFKAEPVVRRSAWERLRDDDNWL